MSTWEQAALLDDDLRPTIPRPTRAEVARIRAEIDAHKERMAEAEASLQEPPAGGVPRNRLLEELREEIARPLEPREDDDDFDMSYVGNIAGSSPLSRILDQQQRIARIGSTYQFKGLLDGVLGRNAATFAGVSASLAAAAVLPRMRAWEPLVDMTSHVGGSAALHAMGTASLASLPSVGTSAMETIRQWAPTSPAFDTLRNTGDLARRTIEETSGLLGAASSARSMLDALVPTFNARTSLSGLIDDLILSQNYKHLGLPTTYEGAVLALGDQVLPSRVDMTSWATGLSAPTALAGLDNLRFDSLRQEVMGAWAHAAPGLDVDVDALLGRFAPSRNVPSGASDVALDLPTVPDLRNASDDAVRATLNPTAQQANRARKRAAVRRKFAAISVDTLLPQNLPRHVRRGIVLGLLLTLETLMPELLSAILDKVDIYMFAVLLDSYVSGKK